MQSTKTRKTTRYIVKRIEPHHNIDDITQFLVDCGEQIEKMFPGYDWRKFKIRSFIQNHYLIICYRDGSPVGFLMASFSRSFFDQDIITLRQNILFSLPNTRAAYLLLKEFLDFGKAHANHVITTIGKFTNIKPESLIRLGFKKLEETYRAEFNRE